MASFSTTCGWCGRFANMRPYGEPHTVIAKSWRTTSGGTRKTEQTVCRCDHCGQLSLAIRTGSAVDSHSELRLVHKEEWLPAFVAGRSFEDVPPEIGSIADEAHKCASIGAYRGAVVLARAVVEATAKEKGISVNGIGNKIDKLYEQNLIREHVKEAAHEVRFGGNSVAHGDLDDLTEEETDEILGLMREILEEVFQSPARVQRQRQKRLARKAGKADAATPTGTTGPSQSGLDFSSISTGSTPP
ncbi:DUF4145 domain-containing protein [Streptomyces sp. NPDC006147]|uniref:DUF4145 domain-containing protein n=1 Tax=Streptomyces sp. NPDC006147 TaxID=3155597 RepID=UPI00339DF62B